MSASEHSDGCVRFQQAALLLVASSMCTDSHLQVPKALALRALLTARLRAITAATTPLRRTTGTGSGTPNATRAPVATGATSATATTLATWLLVLHLGALNHALMRAHITTAAWSAESCADADAYQDASFQKALVEVKAVMTDFASQLEQGVVEGILRRRGWTQLLRYNAQLYGDTCGHFAIALNGAALPACCE